MVERDGAGGHDRPIQLLGMEHRGRSAHAPNCQRQHADHPRRHYEPPPVLARLQPVRAKPSRIRPDGWAHSALPSSLLPQRRFRKNQVVMFNEVYSYNTRVSRLHLQHHRHRCRQVRISAYVITLWQIL